VLAVLTNAGARAAGPGRFVLGSAGFGAMTPGTVVTLARMRPRLTFAPSARIVGMARRVTPPAPELILSAS
jgi:hypothetical protein